MSKELRDLQEKFPDQYLQYLQAMESRGHFKYQSLYNAINNFPEISPELKA